MDGVTKKSLSKHETLGKPVQILPESDKICTPVKYRKMYVKYAQYIFHNEICTLETS